MISVAARSSLWFTRLGAALFYASGHSRTNGCSFTVHSAHYVPSPPDVMRLRTSLDDCLTLHSSSQHATPTTLSLSPPTALGHAAVAVCCQPHRVMSAPAESSSSAAAVQWLPPSSSARLPCELFDLFGPTLSGTAHRRQSTHASASSSLPQSLVPLPVALLAAPSVAAWKRAVESARQSNAADSVVLSPPSAAASSTADNSAVSTPTAALSDAGYYARLLLAKRARVSLTSIHPSTRCRCSRSRHSAGSSAYRLSSGCGRARVAHTATSCCVR